MIDVEFIRPGRGVGIDADPTNPDFLRRKVEIAAAVRCSMRESNLARINVGSIDLITPDALGDDDTAWPKGPVVIRNHVEIVEVELGPSYVRYCDDVMYPAEPIVIPVHATSILFSARHDRSADWYTTGIITCEDEALIEGEANNPFFIWIEH